MKIYDYTTGYINDLPHGVKFYDMTGEVDFKNLRMRYG